MDDIITRVREMLVPVFGCRSADEIQPHHSLVHDLGAESLDFVEIVHLVQKRFGVALEMREIMQVGDSAKMEDLFREGRLTVQGEEILKRRFPGDSRFQAGMTKVDMFALLTVADLARIIQERSQGAPQG